MKKTMTISFIGAGKVATRLATAFHRNGFVISEIFSRSHSAVRKLAQNVNARPVKRLTSLSPYADLFVIAVPDGAIGQVASRMKNTGLPAGQKGMPSLRLLVHTSGSTPMDILQPASGNYGVFYPLQTLQKSVDVDFTDVPICIEANNSSTQKLLVRLARSISSKVFIVDSDKRRMLHLAAVFACNFSNHMYAIAEKILEKTDKDFSILRPLIKETARRAGEYLPSRVQTGPAARKDKKVITLHLQMLKNEPGLKKIYRLLSNNIMNNS